MTKVFTLQLHSSSDSILAERDRNTLRRTRRVLRSLVTALILHDTHIADYMAKNGWTPDELEGLIERLRVMLELSKPQ